jgi:hypothetical protein
LFGGQRNKQKTGLQALKVDRSQVIYHSTDGIYLGVLVLRVRGLERTPLAGSGCARLLVGVRVD